MTCRACMVIAFDVSTHADAAVAAYMIRRNLDHLRNVEVTVLDDGAPTLPAATATGPANKKESNT